VDPIPDVAAHGLSFEVYTAGDPQSDRLALLLHGFPEHAFSWRHQLPLFAKLGFRVWAPNQRGYGKSSRPKGVRSYRIDELVADVAGLIDASGKSRVTLVGHDWGGLVAWEFALRRTRPLERLVILNVPHPARIREELASNRAQRRRSLYATFFQLPWLPEWLLVRKGAAAIAEAFRGMAIDKSRFPDDVVTVFQQNALQPGALTAMLNWYRANGRHFGALGRKAPAALPVIETPTLLIWGEEDRALGKETSFGTERFVADLTLRYLPRVSHWVQQEAPEAVNEILESWLSQPRGRGSPTRSPAL
jgi:pimeloyl-ACP methyl ester carboxylesterase